MNLFVWIVIKCDKLVEVGFSDFVVRFVFGFDWFVEFYFMDGCD